MKKNNILFTAVFVALALGLMGLYHVLGFDDLEGPQDYLLGALWLLLIIVFVNIIIRRENIRKELIRRFYLDSGVVYNSEYGAVSREIVVPNNSATEFCAYAAGVLEDLKHNFKVADRPEDFKPDQVVRTYAYKSHRDPDQGILVDAWEGELARVLSDAELAARKAAAAAAGTKLPRKKKGEENFETIATFSTPQELERVLVQHGVLS